MNQPVFDFIKSISSEQIRARIAVLKEQDPSVLTLSFMIGDERLLEWAHTVGVCEDGVLRDLAPPIAPPRLRQITASHQEPVFLWTGLHDLATFVSHYRRYGSAAGPIRTLDFGCGGGRMTRFLSMAADFQVHGSDINPDHVDWCRSNLLNVRTELNGVSPPLAFDENSLDFIYALSVFSHLSEDSMAAWLQELHRVADKDAVLLLTTHGENALQTIIGSEVHQGMFKMTAQEAQHVLHELPNEPYVHLVYDEDVQILAKAGEGYGNCFMSRNYVESRWPEFGFELLEYIPGGMRGFQDIVLLRKL